MHDRVWKYEWKCAVCLSVLIRLARHQNSFYSNFPRVMTLVLKRRRYGMISTVAGYRDPHLQATEGIKLRAAWNNKLRCVISWLFYTCTPSDIDSHRCALPLCCQEVGIKHLCLWAFCFVVVFALYIIAALYQPYRRRIGVDPSMFT